MGGCKYILSHFVSKVRGLHIEGSPGLSHLFLSLETLLAKYLQDQIGIRKFDKKFDNALTSILAISVHLAISRDQIVYLESSHEKFLRAISFICSIRSGRVTGGNKTLIVICLTECLVNRDVR